MARILRWSLAVVLIAIGIVVQPTHGVAAEPKDDSAAVDDEGAPELLREVLDATGRRYARAKSALDSSMRRQLTLRVKMQQAQARRDALLPEVVRMAAESYRFGKVTPLSALLNTTSPDAFLLKAQMFDEVNRVNDRRLRELNDAASTVQRAKAEMDREVTEGRLQLKIMNKQKSQAEKALALVGGEELTGGLVAATSPVARAAPRGPNGEWRDETCSEDDPTTGGCVTPRTLNALREAKKAFFTRFVGCYRPGGPYEHPKGRACDWSLRSKGFSPARNTDEKIYGNNLAAFLVRNADRLGILYVIWYQKIWFPATGWKSYSGPKDHKDHVHMSML